MWNNAHGRSLATSVDAFPAVRFDVRISLYSLYSFCPLHVEGWLATNGVMGLGRANNSGLLLFGVASTEEKLLKAISNLETEVNEPAETTAFFASREKSVCDMSRIAAIIRATVGVALRPTLSLTIARSIRRTDRCFRRTTTACTRDSSISRRACNPRAAGA